MEWIIMSLAIVSTISWILILVFAEQNGKTRSTKNQILAATFAIIAIVGTTITGTFIERITPTDIHSTKFRVSTKIETKLVNGIEVKRDTVYSFKQIK